MSDMISGMDSSPSTFNRRFLGRGTERRMSPPEPSKRGLDTTFRKVGRFLCLGAPQVSPGSESGVFSPALLKPSSQQTALTPLPDANVHLHIAHKLQYSSKKGNPQGDDSSACRRRIDQLVKELAEKDALCAQLQQRDAERDSLCAQLQQTVAELQQKDAASEERMMSELVAKVMARASFHASEELRIEEKAVADAATAQLRAENARLQGHCATLWHEREQFRDISLQLDAKLEAGLEECTALKAESEERMTELHIEQEENRALQQECRQLQLRHVAQVSSMRQKYAALDGWMQAARKQATLRVQRLVASLKEGQQREEEAHETVQELKEELAQVRTLLEEARQREEEAQEELEESKEEAQELKEELHEVKEEMQEVKEQLAEVVKHNEAVRNCAEALMAEVKQLEGCLRRRASRLAVPPQDGCALVRQAGEGSQGSVDYHEMNGVLVAVKKAKDEEDERALLLEEEILACMDHTSIPKPLAWLTMDDGGLGLAMPAITGGSLHDLLRHSPDTGEAGVRLSIAEGMSLIDQGAEALQYAHSGGYVHSDIKPSNLMLDAEGRLMIIDWGSAYNISERPGTWGGSNGYVRPAVAASLENMGPEDDIRGLCVVGLELATGLSMSDSLRWQYECLYSSDETSSIIEVAKKEKAKEKITDFCESHPGLDPFEFMDRMLAAEYLGHISIKEEDFEPYLNEEGAPCEYLRLMLRAVSRPVGCGEAPMPTLQEIRNAISSYLAAAAGPCSEAASA